MSALSIILPLLSSVIYVAGALLLKRAGELGANTWQIVRLCNVATAVALAPMWFLGGVIPPMTQWWQPGVVALIFLGGQILSILALRVGDVSIATPVLGVKILLVAVFVTVLLHERLGPALWVAAALGTVGIAFLNVSRPRTPHRIGTTIALSGFAASCYALFDVLVQNWSAAWGPGRFAPITVSFAAVLSLAFRASDRAGASAPFRSWALAGAICLAMQGALFVCSIAVFRHATTANVLYGSRGLWSVIVVWLLGKRFGAEESGHSNAIMLWRLVGATLMLIAIVLVAGDMGRQ